MLQNSNIINKNYMFTTVYYDVLEDQAEVKSNLSIQPLQSLVTLKTPNGSPVQAFLFEDGIDIDLGLILASDVSAGIKRDYPNVTIITNTFTSRYNCHSYAWLGGITSNLWIEDPSPYWNDGSYYLAAINNITAVGQIIYYPGIKDKHSGIVRSLTGNSQIESKWGQGPRVKHYSGDCPYAIIPANVYLYSR